MKVIVVTGGIGSGKSLACSILEDRGIPVYDCDSHAKLLYKAHPDLAAMAKADIFEHPQKLKELEDRLFPILLEDFKLWSEKQGKDLVALESATILQKTFFNGFGDYVLLVEADTATRLSRALARGNVSEDSIKARMALQPDEKDNPRVSAVIDNSGTAEQLETQIRNFLKSIDYGNRKN